MFFEDNYRIVPGDKTKLALDELKNAAAPLAKWLRDNGGDFAIVTSDFIKVCDNQLATSLPAALPTTIEIQREEANDK